MADAERPRDLLGFETLRHEAENLALPIRQFCEFRLQREYSVHDGTHSLVTKSRPSADACWTERSQG
jgi:hypothetical protein